MKVLLIYPEFPDTFWSFKHALKFIRKRASLPPLGLLTVAAMLPSAWEKRLVDLNVRELTDKDLAWADIAFISAMTVQRKSPHQVIARCKSIGLKIVAGGPLFTTEYDQFETVDHFVLNEAELTLPPFLYSRAVMKHSSKIPIVNVEQVQPEGNEYSGMWEIYPEGMYETLQQVWSYFQPSPALTPSPSPNHGRGEQIPLTGEGGRVELMVTEKNAVDTV